MLDCRNKKVYYVRCPDLPFHFVVVDACAPAFASSPPPIPMLMECPGCPPGNSVQINTPWECGYVSQTEAARGYTYREPQERADEPHVRKSAGVPASLE